ncbi:MAG TPA: hypothetical protein VGW10_19095, partial [Solirubrobacteraceae bacterium]|nr:hypothetical protein [Solirubrobacteraceae bacterium]
MATGSPKPGPDQAPDTGDRAPAGRLRLAAGLAGAGVLAIGFGTGIVQSAAQDDPAAPGQDAVGAGEPVVAPAAQAPAESPAVTKTDTSTAAAPMSSTGAAPEPRAADPAVPTPEEPAATEQPVPAEQPGAEQP